MRARAAPFMGTEFRGQPQGELRLMQIRSIALITAFAALGLVAANVSGCSSSKPPGVEPGGGGDEDGGDGSTSSSGGFMNPPDEGGGGPVLCANCTVQSCSGGTSTTITGVV